MYVRKPKGRKERCREGYPLCCSTSRRFSGETAMSILFLFLLFLREFNILAIEFPTFKGKKVETSSLSPPPPPLPRLVRVVIK